MEPSPTDHNGAGDGWAGLERSAAYLRQLAELYQDSFVAAKKPVAKAHVLEAQRQAREALELLAGNLLNTSSAMLARIEAQDATVEALRDQLDRVRDQLQEQRREADEEVVRQFYGRSRAECRRLNARNGAEQLQIADDGA